MAMIGRRGWEEGRGTVMKERGRGIRGRRRGQGGSIHVPISCWSVLVVKHLYIGWTMVVIYGLRGNYHRVCFQGFVNGRVSGRGYGLGGGK